MELEKALRVYKTRLSPKGEITASWRSVSFIIEGHEDQMDGYYLCIDAMKRLQKMTEAEELLYGPIEHVERLKE